MVVMKIFILIYQVLLEDQTRIAKLCVGECVFIGDYFSVLLFRPSLLLCQR